MAFDLLSQVINGLVIVEEVNSSEEDIGDEANDENDVDFDIEDEN